MIGRPVKDESFTATAGRRGVALAPGAPSLRRGARHSPPVRDGIRFGADVRSPALSLSLPLSRSRRVRRSGPSTFRPLFAHPPARFLPLAGRKRRERENVGRGRRRCARARAKRRGPLFILGRCCVCVGPARACARRSRLGPTPSPNVYPAVSVPPREDV